MSNTQPLPDITMIQPDKPATSMERLVRIETLLLLTYRRFVFMESLVVAVLVAVAFVLGHVWR